MTENLKALNNVTTQFMDVMSDVFDEALNEPVKDDKNESRYLVEKEDYSIIIGNVSEIIINDEDVMFIDIVGDIVGYFKRNDINGFHKY